ncbi:hypothetical protein SteCoe_22592 [Stentor coeruleus]|uniref:Uncharacterized protein n=1 Tax=Stentor coeruleus TaxID=5963 RepID=A0A1R2BM11_9CILI|nr:hypothetical protein SteCoe_22592 [Stentor coeruleus]
MVDQNELIEQYRTTLEVMKEKLANLREDKEKQVQEILEKKSTSVEFQKLEQNLEILQEGIQSLNLEIFKEKGNLRKLKADNEWGEEKLMNSEEILSLKRELDETIQKNNELKTDKNTTNTESKLAQLEQSNPKLFGLVKKIIMVEETNFLLKEELSFLEQERNKIRADYYKITQCLGQKEKLKLKTREVEKEIERSETNIHYMNKRLEDLAYDLEREKEIVKKSEVKHLFDKLDELKQKKQESGKKVADLFDQIENFDIEIESERKCENKIPPTNLKQEIKNLEAEITERTKELKQRQAEKKRLQIVLEQKLKEFAMNKKSRLRSAVDMQSTSLSKHTLSKSTPSLITANSTKRLMSKGLV